MSNKCLLSTLFRFAVVKSETVKLGVNVLGEAVKQAQLPSIIKIKGGSILSLLTPPNPSLSDTLNEQYPEQHKEYVSYHFTYIFFIPKADSERSLWFVFMCVCHIVLLFNAVYVK